MTKWGHSCYLCRVGRGTQARYVELEWSGPRRIARRRRLNLDAAPRRLEGFDVEVPECVRLWLLPGARFGIPERMSVRLRDDRYPAVEIDFSLEEGRLVCDAVRRQAGKPPLAGRDLRRVSLSKHIEDVLAAVAVAVEEEPDGTLRGRWVKAAGGSALETFLDEADRAGLRPKSGRRLTRKHYEAVAAVAIAARAEGRAVLEAIQEELGASPTTAKRWKREAERRGLIPTKERKR